MGGSGLRTVQRPRGASCVCKDWTVQLSQGQELTSSPVTSALAAGSHKRTHGMPHSASALFTDTVISTERASALRNSDLPGYFQMSEERQN